MTTHVFAPANTDGVNLHRVLNPAMFTGAMVLPLGFEDIPLGATHIIFNSLFTYTSGFQAKMFAACRDQGLKVILDLDDHWEIPKTHSQYPQLTGSNYAKEVVQCIKAADMVWCASRLLLDEVKKLNKNAHYVPNTFALTYRSPVSQGKRFGYVASSQDHLRDAELLRKAFAKLGQENNELQVGWCGYQPTEQGDKMRQLFASAGAHFIGEYLPPSSYWWHFQSIDVALAPLEKTAWNSYKSNLKAIEAGIMGCSLVCSDAPPYEELEHGTNCLKARTQMDWYRQIKKLNAEPELAHELSANLQEYVTEVFNPHDWATKRMQLIESL